MAEMINSGKGPCMTSPPSISMLERFFRTFLVFLNGTEPFTRSIFVRTAEEIDKLVHICLRHFLFTSVRREFRFVFIALSLQRIGDHSLRRRSDFK